MAVGEQEMYGQQVVGVYLKVLFRYPFAGTEENHENPQTRQSVSRPQIEPGTTRPPRMEYKLDVYSLGQPDDAGWLHSRPHVTASPTNRCFRISPPYSSLLYTTNGTF